MGHRTLKRVPLDFDWPLNEVWRGYIMPDHLQELPCEACDGSGYSLMASYYKDLWYGYVPFAPEETGSTPLTPDTPAVHRRAANNVGRYPYFYGREEDVIRKEARRLCEFWNGSWSHHLDQDDVDALVAANRLVDLTHEFVRGEGWVAKNPTPTITAQQVNEWSLEGLGHDAINCWVVVKAKCKREGSESTCRWCEGHGEVEKYEGQRAEAEAWEPVEPPLGPGFQLWETVSEGSPISPVFESAEALAEWCEGNASLFANDYCSRADWLKMFTEDTLEVNSLLIVRINGS